MDGATARQWRAYIFGMNWADMTPFITYKTDLNKDTAWARSQVSYYSAWCGPSTSPAVGVVDMQKYGDWLAGQGVAMKYASASSN